MSRSRRSSPFVGHTTAPSDKPWKQQHARRVRRAVHQTLGQTVDGDAVPTNRYAFGSAAWDGIKDGKQRVADTDWKMLRTSGVRVSVGWHCAGIVVDTPWQA